jgi:hypothetical protein
MTDEQPNKKEDVTQSGAVEIDEEALDKAAGGASFNYLKIDTELEAVQKQVPKGPQSCLNNKNPEL